MEELEEKKYQKLILRNKAEPSVAKSRWKIIKEIFVPEKYNFV